MEFSSAIINIVNSIEKTTNIDFLVKQDETLILKSYLKYCDTKNDFLQFQEYKNILSLNISVASPLVSGYVTAKNNGDKTFNALKNSIESLFTNLDNKKVSSYYYAYFIYSYLNLFINKYNDNDLKKLIKDEIKWLEPSEFDLSGQYKVSNENTFGYGTYTFDLTKFVIFDDCLKQYSGTDPYVIVPNNVRVISKHAFRGDRNIKSIFIPDSVIKIEAEAFSNCEYLETVILNDNITVLENETFSGCKRLKRINLDNIRRIGDYCFKDAISLRSVNLNKLESVGKYALAYVINLDNYDFIKNLVSIGSYAFKGCLINNITLNKCNELMSYAFAECYGIREININSFIYNLGENVFSSSLNLETFNITEAFNYDIYKLFTNDLTDFNNNFIKLKSIKVCKLNNNMFNGYTNITEVVVSDSDIVCENAFNSCSNLKVVHMLKGVREVLDSAFYNCINLVNIKGDLRFTIASAKSFYGCSKLDVKTFDKCLKFLDMSLARCDLSKFNFNRKFKYIGLFAFANSVFPSIDTLDLSSTTVMPGAFHGLKNINTLILDDLDNLHNNDFKLLFSQNIDCFNNEVMIDNVIVKGNIYDSSFLDIKNIENVTFSIKDEIIPKNAFKNSNIKHINIDGFVSVIDSSAFMNCKNLSRLDMDYDQIKVFDNAFMNVNNINDLIDFNKVIYYGPLSFAYTDLYELIINSNYEYISDDAFKNAANISLVSIPDMFEETNLFSSNNIDKSKIKTLVLRTNDITTEFFNGFINLESIVLEEVDKLTDSYFINNKNLKSIYIGPKASVISPFIFEGLNNNVDLYIDSNNPNFMVDNKNIYSLDKTKLYYLHKDNDLNSIITKVNFISALAVTDARDEVYLDSNVKLDRYSIDALNVRELTLIDKEDSISEAIYNCDNLTSIVVSGNIKKGILSTNKDSLDIIELTINDSNILSIKSLFNTDVNLNIDTLNIKNISSLAILKGIKYINNLYINDYIDNYNGLLSNTKVNNLFIKKLHTPLYLLFNSNNYNINYVHINEATLVSDAFNNMNINKIEINHCLTINSNAFSNSKINSLSITNLDNVLVGGFINSSINKIEVTNKYVVKDNMLILDDKLIYYFNKNISDLTIPFYIKRVAYGALDSLTNLHILRIGHEDILFDSGSIINTNIDTLYIGSIKNNTIREIFSAEEDSIKTIYYSNNYIKPKYFSYLTNLTDFICDDLLEVSDLAFASAYSLTNIDLSKVEVIGDLSFYECRSLECVNILNCNSLGLSSFKYTDNLKELSINISDDDSNKCMTIFDVISNTDVTVNVNGNIIPSYYFKDYSGKVNCLNSPLTIGDFAFDNCNDLTISLENTTRIGKYAFVNAKFIELDLNDIVEISDYAFNNCELLNKLNLGPSLEVVSKLSFDGCPLEVININENNTHYHVNNNAFMYDSSTNELIFIAPKTDISVLTFDSSSGPLITNTVCDLNVCKLILNGVVSISEGAINNCNNLKEIIISDCNNISGPFISNCNNLESITIDKINVNGCHKLGALFKDGVPNSLKSIYIKESIHSDTFDEVYENIQEVILGEDITTIPDNFFVNVYNILEFNISDKCKAIGGYAFKGCKNILSLDLTNVTNFGENALYGLTALRHLELPFIGKNINEPTKLNYLLSCDDNLESVIIKNGEIIDYAFSCFNNIKHVTLPVNLKVIGSFAFNNMCSLEEISNIHQVTNIGDEAFSNCVKLNISDFSNVTYFGKNVFKNCESINSLILPFIGSTINNPTLLTYILGFTSNVSDITVLDGKIIAECFKGFNSITKITIPSTVTEIEALTFKGLSNLEEVVGFDHIKYVYESAFEDCTNFKATTFEHLLSISDKAFSNCLGLNSITLNKDVLYVGQKQFMGSINISSAELPFKDDVLTLENIFGNPFDTLVSVNINNGPIKIDSFSNFKVESLTLNDSVTEIYDLMFKDNLYIKEINASNLEVIGACAFEGAKNFSHINLNNVKVIKPFAFTNSSLEGNISILNVSEISESCFENTNISECKLLNTTVIGRNAFKDCTNLCSINLDKVLEFGDSAFSNTKLKTIRLNDLVSVIPNNLFSNTKLEDINLPSSLVEIGDKAFSYTNFKKRKFNCPSTLVKVGSTIFYGSSGAKFIISDIKQTKTWANDWDFISKGFLGKRKVKVIKGGNK